MLPLEGGWVGGCRGFKPLNLVGGGTRFKSLLNEFVSFTKFRFGNLLNVFLAFTISALVFTKFSLGIY